MKLALLSLVTVAAVILCVECRSPPRCSGRCDKSRCSPVDNCQCGTYLGQCQCCEFCLKCPGEDCSFVAKHRCTEGYKCRHTEKLNSVDRFNKPGKCLIIEDEDYEDDEEED